MSIFTNDGVRYAAVFEMALHFSDGRKMHFLAAFVESPVVEEVIRRLPLFMKMYVPTFSESSGNSWHIRLSFRCVIFHARQVSQRAMNSFSSAFIRGQTILSLARLWRPSVPVW